jgi:hypothetical protein
MARGDLSVAIIIVIIKIIMLFGKKCRIRHVTTLLNYVEMDASVSSYTRQPKDAGNTS